MQSVILYGRVRILRRGWRQSKKLKRSKSNKEDSKSVILLVAFNLVTSATLVASVLKAGTDATTTIRCRFYCVVYNLHKRV